jgi:hypothetical protein
MPKKKDKKYRKPGIDPKRDIDSDDPFPVEEPVKKKKIIEPGKPRPRKK